MLQRDYPTYFIIFKHAAYDLFAIHLIYDHQNRHSIPKEHILDLPLRWLSAQEFLETACTYHKNDRFAVSLVDSMCYLETQFDIDVILTLIKEEISSDCRLALHQDKEHTFSDTLAGKYGFSPDEQRSINDIIDKIREEIKSDLQFQYDHLKQLSFIEK